MKAMRLRVLVLLLLLLVAGCGRAEPAATPAAATQPATASPVPTTAAALPATAPPSATTSPAEPETAAPAPTDAAPPPDVPGLSDDEVATLNSLQRLDDYPLYTMRYQGAYTPRAASRTEGPRATVPGTPPGWACSLFATLAPAGDGQEMLYGRNFDWEFSPALLLFTDPPDGYASVSMVDIAYLGFAGDAAAAVDSLPLAGRQGLLHAPWLPFDGLNEAGLAVGMAAVPPGNVPPDPQKPTIGSLGVIRDMLDRAATVDEARAILESYNVDATGGPPLHYLVADRTGHALLFEFYDGALHVIPNEGPWHLATNFLRASVAEAQGQCPRYDALSERLAQAEGRLGPNQALDLLSDVAQPHTQWSVVYGLDSGRVWVTLGRHYERVHELALDGE